MMKLMIKHETELMELRAEKETWEDQQNKLRENVTELSSKFSVANSDLLNEKQMHNLLKNKHGQQDVHLTKLKELVDESEEKIQHAQEKLLVANLRVEVIENDN